MTVVTNVDNEVIAVLVDCTAEDVAQDPSSLIPPFYQDEPLLLYDVGSYEEIDEVLEENRPDYKGKLVLEFEKIIYDDNDKTAD